MLDRASDKASLLCLNSKTIQRNNLSLLCNLQSGRDSGRYFLQAILLKMFYMMKPTSIGLMVQTNHVHLSQSTSSQKLLKTQNKSSTQPVSNPKVQTARPLRSRPLRDSRPLLSRPLRDSRPLRSRPLWSRPLWSIPLWSRPLWSRPLRSRPLWSRPL